MMRFLQMLEAEPIVADAAAVTAAAAADHAAFLWWRRDQAETSKIRERLLVLDAVSRSSPRPHDPNVRVDGKLPTGTDDRLPIERGIKSIVLPSLDASTAARSREPGPLWAWL